MAKLVIKGYEQRALYPDSEVKHYRVNVALVTSDGKEHETHCLLSKEPNSPLFDFGCFDNSDIDEFDYRNKWKMSEQVIKWAHDNILEANCKQS